MRKVRDKAEEIEDAVLGRDGAELVQNTTDASMATQPAANGPPAYPGPPQPTHYPQQPMMTGGMMQQAGGVGHDTVGRSRH